MERNELKMENRENDVRREDFESMHAKELDMIKMLKLKNELAREELEIEKARNQEKERNLAAMNREAMYHSMNLAHVEHQRLGFDKLLYVDPKESKALKHLMESPYLDKVKTDMVNEK